MNRQPFIFVLPIVIVLAILGMSNSASAQINTPALDFSTDGGYTNGFNGTMGWEFTANNTTNLTAFGFYNNGGTVDISHQVGLWDTSGDLLDSGTVGPSASDTTVGYFDYSATAPYTLQAGHSYVIGTLLSPGDYFYYDPSSITTPPSISYVQTQFDVNDTSALTFPQTTDFPSNGYGYFGPNFEVATVPEPSTLFGCGTMLALGIALVWAGGKRRIAALKRG